MLNKAIRSLDTLNEATTTVTGTLATVMLMVMTTVVTVHVVLRYGFNYSMVWTEETARFLMVWMTFLYFPTGHKRGLNVAVDFAVARWRDTRPGIAVRLLIELVVVLLTLTCISLSFKMVGRGMTTVSQSLQIPMSWVYAVLPLSFFLTFLCSLESLLCLVKEFFEGPDAKAGDDATPSIVSSAD